MYKPLTLALATSALFVTSGLSSGAIADDGPCRSGRSSRKTCRKDEPTRADDNVDIDFKPHKRPEQGRLGGFDPVVTELHVGDRVRFSNTDDIQHAIVGYAFGGGSIPEDDHIQGDPTKPHGNTIDASEFGTGNLRPHSVGTPVFTAKTPGTFYFACAYHQKMMRGAIVVKR